MRTASVGLSLLLLAGVCITGAVSADVCPPNYDTNFYNCLAGKYLCPKPLCACPGSKGAADFDCYDPASKGCPANSGNPLSGLLDGSKDNSKGYCPSGSSSGDPLVKGFDGCAWYLQGKPDTVLNLISEANHVVNTKLVAANLTDEHHGGEGTFHGAISIRFRDAVVTASTDPEGNLTVLLGREAVPFEAVREQSGLTVKVNQYYPYYGQVTEVVTPAFRFFIHVVQPYDTPGGWSRGHLDFYATMISATTNLKMHGLLGQSFHRAGALCFEDFNFHGEGDEQEYAMADLSSIDFIYSRFSGENFMRQLLTADIGTVYIPSVSALTAHSKGMF